MSIEESAKIKAQEWMVRFDGTIKQSETLIDSDSHHEDLAKITSEED